MTQPARVLHLIETGGPGGAEAMFADLVSHLDRGRFESEAALLRGGGWLEERLGEAGIQPLPVRSGGRFDLTLVKDLVRLIRAKRIDLVHAHLMDMNFYAGIAGAIARVPVVATEHGDVHHPGKAGKIHWAKPKAISRLAKRWVAVSEFTRTRLLEEFGIPGDRVYVVYNGIRLPDGWEEPDDGELRKELGIPPDAFTIGTVGSLYPVKGHVYLVEAVREISAELPGARLVIAGRGDEETRLRERAAELGVADRVHLLGLRGDVPDLLRIFDVFAMPSLSEGLPLSLLEAMAAGRVVIASRVGGIPEVIEDGVNGFMIEPKDVTGLGGGIVDVARMGEGKADLEQSARKKIEERFTIQTMVEGYQDLYDGVLRRD